MITSEASYGVAHASDNAIGSPGSHALMQSWHALHEPFIIGVTLLTLLVVTLLVRLAAGRQPNSLVYAELAADISAAAIIHGTAIMSVVLFLEYMLNNCLSKLWISVPFALGAGAIILSRLLVRELHKRSAAVYTPIDFGRSFLLLLLAVYALCSASALTTHVISSEEGRKQICPKAEASSQSSFW